MKTKKNSLKFPIFENFGAQMEEFTSRVEQALTEDTEEAHTAAVRSYLDLSRDLLPDEYRVLTDAWGDLNRDPTTTNFDTYNKVCARIMYRANHGEYPRV